MRTRARWFALCLVSAAVAGCSGTPQTGVLPQPVSSSPASTSTLPTPSARTANVDGEARPAVDAYDAFLQAADASERHPGQPDLKRLRAVAVDPARTLLVGSLDEYSVQGIKFVGVPPDARITVASVRMKGHPWPVVVAANCPTVSESWRPIYGRSRKPVKLADQQARPPYRTIATIIKFHGRWVVEKTSLDRSHTCTP